MNIISFNANGIRARQHQLTALIDKYQPDILGIQETKVSDEEFPTEALEALGYHVHFHGQKGHYGVCLLSRCEPLSIQKGFAADDELSQRRLILGEYPTPGGQTVTVINGYFPQGENIAHPTKFPAKRKFYQDLQALLEKEFSPDQPLLVMGDMNISPQDCDIGIGDDNRKRWLRTGKTSFQPEERGWLDALKEWGLIDTFRALHPDTDDRFSWFDYRSRGFERDPRRGLRIDLILATRSLRGCCEDAGIDYEIRAMPRPSDHCPVWARFSL